MALHVPGDRHPASTYPACPCQTTDRGLALPATKSGAASGLAVARYRAPFCSSNKLSSEPSRHWRILTGPHTEAERGQSRQRECSRRVGEGGEGHPAWGWQKSSLWFTGQAHMGLHHLLWKRPHETTLSSALKATQGSSPAAGQGTKRFRSPVATNGLLPH